MPVKEIAELDNPSLGNINAESNSPEGVFLREIASLYRSDGAILVSSAEAQRLEKILGKKFMEDKVPGSYYYTTMLTLFSLGVPCTVLLSKRHQSTAKENGQRLFHDRELQTSSEFGRV